MDIMTAPLWVNLYYPEMKEDWNLKFNQSIKEQQTSLNNFLQQDGLVDEINNLQRDLFHCFELLIDNKSSFLPALPVEMLTKDGKQASNLRLFRDDFPLLRDIYITTFESCHKTLKYIVAIINIAHRGDPNKFYRNNPNNLNRFSKLPNAKKVEPLKELEVWYQLWNTILNRPMRNAIGHHGICHDLSSGMLLLKNEEKIPYLDFVVQCFGLMHPLLACCNALKTYRIGLSLN